MAISSSIKITDNSKEVKRMSAQAKERALTKIGLKWDENVARLVPVDTGNLRNSRQYDVKQNEVEVGFSSEYSAFVELGTSKQRAQPYLKPSILDNVDDYKQIVENELKNA